LVVEIDIVLPPDCPLSEAHDIGEALQDAFEMLDIVERAFVHLDYTSEHEFEHRRVVEQIGFGH
jgi:divalent metal cation (Fe/Co/Zn/Cd) transporter